MGYGARCDVKGVARGEGVGGTGEGGRRESAVSVCGESEGEREKKSKKQNKRKKQSEPSAVLTVSRWLYAMSAVEECERVVAAACMGEGGGGGGGGGRGTRGSQSSWASAGHSERDRDRSVLP